MGTTHNTPNKNAPGPKASGGSTAKKAPAKKAAPAKKGAAKAAPAKAAATLEPVEVEQVEVRRGSKLVFLGELAKDSIKVTFADGKLTVTGREAGEVETAGAEEVTDEQPVPAKVVENEQPGEPLTDEEFDAVIETGSGANEAVAFQADPRVVTQIHDGAIAADGPKGK